jgi:hypothetical protein
MIDGVGRVRDRMVPRTRDVAAMVRAGGEHVERGNGLPKLKPRAAEARVAVWSADPVVGAREAAADRGIKISCQDADVVGGAVRGGVFEFVEGGGPCACRMR